MTEFVRVRDKRTKHEFDTTRERADLHSDDFTVIDEEPVSQPREPKVAGKTGKPSGNSEPVGKTTKE